MPHKTHIYITFFLFIYLITGSSSVKLIGGVQVLPAGAIAPGGRAAVVKECVSSPEDQIDGGFTQKKEKIPDDKVCPPYAQIKKGHPYAQVSKSWVYIYISL